MHGFCLSPTRTSIRRRIRIRPYRWTSTVSRTYSTHPVRRAVPKGWQSSIASGVAFLGWVHSVFSPGELAGTLAGTSICFDLSVFEIFAPLTSGRHHPAGEYALALPDLSARNEVTLVNTGSFSDDPALLGVRGLPAGDARRESRGRTAAEPAEVAGHFTATSGTVAEGI